MHVWKEEFKFPHPFCEDPPGSTEYIFFWKYSLLYLFENVTQATDVIFWRPSNFVLVRKALAEVKRLLARERGWYVSFNPGLLVSTGTVYTCRGRGL